jgi:hypothetical protein
MGKRGGSYFKAGDYLKQGDYMVSNNGLFHVILQYDGNLCVYRGSGPDDNRGHLWNANSTTKYSVVATWWENPKGFSWDHVFGVAYGTKPGDLKRAGGPTAPMADVWNTGFLNARNFYAIIQDDGNFCIYEGDGPHDNPRWLWCAGSADAIVSFEILGINYDVEHSTIKETKFGNIWTQDVANDMDTPQTSNIRGSESVEEMTGWSDTLGIRIALKTEFKTKIPFVVDGKVELSVEASNEYTWNGSTTHSKDWGFDVPITLQAHTKGRVAITVSISTISVPYTMTGNHVHKNGAKIPGTVTGTYTGTNSYNQQVRFFKPAVNGGLVPASDEELQALLAVSKI